MYTGTKLSFAFHLKDRVLSSCICDIIYSVTCPNLACNETYIDEACRRLHIRAEGHGR